MAQRPTDKYANVAQIEVIETAAGTITFAELVTGISLAQGIGMVIDELDYYPTQTSLDDVVTTPDELGMALTVSNTLANLSPTNRTVIHNCTITAGPTIGTNAGDGRLIKVPFVYQFFPPMIVASPRLYAGIIGASLAAPATLNLRIFFRYIPLTTAEYLEIAEAHLLVG